MVSALTEVISNSSSRACIITDLRRYVERPFKRTHLCTKHKTQSAIHNSQSVMRQTRACAVSLLSTERHSVATNVQRGAKR
ncbi:unnamed protein product [Ceratitis capitata]|uniref:(Mediterranean fruit fly) hypothetical protein n=1 Tax=Ceratitis capitata TaxID=7213 RepID=A0A811V992_CERCA|nr:unnamed protein product [Ceratitis capitata]